MSATKPATQQFFFSNEPITGADLEILNLYAKKSGINLLSASEQMFRVPPDQLTHEQGNELFAMLFEAAMAKQQPVHSHRCVECGAVISCTRQHCNETDDECRQCHEGIITVGRYSWNGKIEVML